MKSHSPRILLIGVVVGVLVLSGAGSARTATPSTTGVDPLVRVSVQITDNALIVKPRLVARLETVYFRIVNKGTKTHDFRVVGLKTPVLNHGQVGHILVQFTDRGQYVYRCALHCSVKMRGLMRVYSPLG